MQHGLKVSGRAMASAEQHSAAAGDPRAQWQGNFPAPDRPQAVAWTNEPLSLRRQVLEIINEVLNEDSTDPRARLRLLGHVAANPGNPELALLAHLRDCQSDGGPPTV